MKRLAFLLLVLSILAACGGGQPSGKAVARKPAGAAGPDVWMELRRGTEPRELVHIGILGAVIGPDGGPLTVKLFPDPRRSDDAWYFLRTYAPFELKSPQGELVFHGKGKVSPGPAEKRMVFEWARAVAAEAAGGRSGGAYGLVLGWHQGGSSGVCHDVALYLTGEAVASACGWSAEVQGRLDPAQLGRVYGWFDRLKPFQAGAGDQDLRQGSLETRLVFAGRGGHEATAGEQEEIQSFGEALFNELAARREGAAPAASPTPEATPPAKTPAPEPPSRLLLPSHPVPPKADDEIVLQLPDEPPPPPPGEGTPPVPPRRPRPRPSPTPEESTPPDTGNTVP
ncbi:MAG TPA: hypothetical protein VIA62_02635 [Thermoanaerobaculia bacterium]|nr:hypothetical protein [Thermoanaerobaculia bacterium]